MIAIVDCNNFYCSCERVFKPKLENKPVVVLSNNDGCVIARSEEAKLLGIKMGHPAYMAEPIFKEHEVAVFSSNYALYGDMSDRVYNILSSAAPEVERYSIDEAFLNLSGFVEQYDLEEYAFNLRVQVKQWTGIPVSVGIAPTKTLSKIANRIVKKEKIADGILLMDTEEKINEALSKIEIEDVWNVGAQYAKLLREHHINTAFDLKYANADWVYKQMTVKGLRTLRELQGIPSIEMEYEADPKKGITTSRCFGKAVYDLNELKEAVVTYITRCAEKLREEKLIASLLSVFVQTNKYKLHTQQYSNTVTIQLPVSTNNTIELIKYALEALARIYKQGICYYKAGVLATGLTPEQAFQSNIFDDTNRKKQSALIKVMDKINLLNGRGTIQTAAEGLEKKWVIKRAMLSPGYTTRWKDMIVVNT